jgi:DNA gyrase/topoisomerase IV subunit B
MKELIEEGHLYCCSPLYLVKKKETKRSTLGMMYNVIKPMKDGRKCSYSTL